MSCVPALLGPVLPQCLFITNFRQFGSEIQSSGISLCTASNEQINRPIGIICGRVLLFECLELIRFFESDNQQQREGST
jgi:hypothetical protein